MLARLLLSLWGAEIAASLLRQRFAIFRGIAPVQPALPRRGSPVAQLDNVHSVLRLNYETLRGLISLASRSVAKPTLCATTFMSRGGPLQRGAALQPSHSRVRRYFCTSGIDEQGMNQRTFRRPFVDPSTVAPYFSGRRPFPRYASVKDTRTIDAAPEGRNTGTGYTPMRWQAPPHPPVSGRWPAPTRPLTRLSACHPVTTPWRPSECLKPF